MELNKKKLTQVTCTIMETFQICGQTWKYIIWKYEFYKKKSNYSVLDSNILSKDIAMLILLKNQLIKDNKINYLIRISLEKKSRTNKKRKKKKQEAERLKLAK